MAVADQVEARLLLATTSQFVRCTVVLRRAVPQVRRSLVTWSLVEQGGVDDLTAGFYRDSLLRDARLQERSVPLVRTRSGGATFTREYSAVDSELLELDLPYARTCGSWRRRRGHGPRVQGPCSKALWSSLRVRWRCASPGGAPFVGRCWRLLGGKFIGCLAWSPARLARLASTPPQPTQPVLLCRRPWKRTAAAGVARRHVPAPNRVSGSTRNAAGRPKPPQLTQLARP